MIGDSLMPIGKKYDLLLKNVRVVRPGVSAVEAGDIAVKDGKIAALGSSLAASDAAEVVDGRNRLAFPGWSMHTCTLASTRRSRRMPSPRAGQQRKAASPRA